MTNEAIRDQIAVIERQILAAAADPEAGALLASFLAADALAAALRAELAAAGEAVGEAARSVIEALAQRDSQPPQEDGS